MPTTHELSIEGHKLVALGFNEDKPWMPVIFLHGIGSSPNFGAATQTPVFKERFRWYSLSLPGHYPAQLPADFRRQDLTAEMIARVLAEAIRQLVGDVPVTLVGYSTGGFAALAIAAQFPAIVKSVISVAGFAQGKWTGALGLLQWWARRGAVGEAVFRLNSRLISASLPMFRVAWLVYPADQRAYRAYPNLDAVIQSCYSDAKSLDLAAMIHYYQRMPDTDISDWLPRISVPVLALVGDRDPIVPTAQSRLIAEKVSNGTLAVLEGVGHLPMMERPDEYARLVTEWAERWA